MRLLTMKNQRKSYSLRYIALTFLDTTFYLLSLLCLFFTAFSFTFSVTVMQTFKEMGRDQFLLLNNAQIFDLMMLKWQLSASFAVALSWLMVMLLILLNVLKKSQHGHALPLNTDNEHHKNQRKEP